MTILIKSFYRPYLLDRCLKSIYGKVIDGEKLNIIVLDDGTPQKYIDEISIKYPNVKFKFSNYRDEKIKKIKNHLDGIENYYDKRIPTDLWYEAISDSSDILIMTEDDVWFIDEFDMKSYTSKMNLLGIHLIKLGRDLYKDSELIPISKLSDNLYSHNPKFLLKSKLFYNLLLNNSFNIRTILEKYGILSKRWIMNLWVMYDIPMGMYRKDYLQFLWKDKFSRVIEYLQLKNAVEWNFNTKGENRYTLLEKNVMQTSFRSSASFNAFNIKENFDLIKFNYLLNELWLKGNFNSYENYPNDFSVEYLYEILSAYEGKEFADQWRKWSEGFIEMYKEL